MSWQVQARRTHEHGTHVKVKWRSIAAIQDVSIDCPHGVLGASRTGLVRREMNVFTNPIDAHLQWSEDVERPFVILSWSDAGEECQQRLPLDSASKRHLRWPSRRALSSR